jgi:glycerophosphoryl diester phosphodiesterase
MGADMVQLDVRCTRDGVFVVHHDRALQGSPPYVIGRTDYEEIRDRPGARGGRIPRLEEVLELCRGRIGMDVELKEAGYEPDVVSLVRRQFEPPSLIFKSFNRTAVRNLRRAAPDVRVAVLLWTPPPRTPMSVVRALFPVASSARLGADIVEPHWKQLRFGFVRRAHAWGMPVYAWTVNSGRKAQDVLRVGVDGLITDRPDVALRAREEFLAREENHRRAGPGSGSGAVAE